MTKAKYLKLLKEASKLKKAKASIDAPFEVVNAYWDICEEIGKASKQLLESGTMTIEELSKMPKI